MDVFHCSAKLRDLIIDRRPPQFEEFLDDECEERIEPIISSLNSNQKQAVTQVGRAHPFCFTCFTFLLYQTIIYWNWRLYVSPYITIHFHYTVRL